MNLGIFVINLDDRQDRFITFMDQFSQANFPPIIRFSAVNGKSLESSHPSPNGVAACWLSHQGVFNEVLENNFSHALIFEDDAKILQHPEDLISEIMQIDLTGLDILQIGYLTRRGRLDSGNYDIIVRLKFNILKICSLALSNLGKKKNKESRKKMNRISLKVIENSFEAGTHAYLINRKTCEILSEANNPVFFAADLYLIALSRSMQLRIGRSSKSLVGQTESHSSISVRERFA